MHERARGGEEGILRISWESQASCQKTSFPQSTVMKVTPANVPMLHLLPDVCPPSRMYPQRRAGPRGGARTAKTNMSFLTLSVPFIRKSRMLE